MPEPAESMPWRLQSRARITLRLHGICLQALKYLYRDNLKALIIYYSCTLKPSRLGTCSLRVRKLQTQLYTLLGSSWVFISRVLSRISIVETCFNLHYALTIRTQPGEVLGARSAWYGSTGIRSSCVSRSKEHKPILAYKRGLITWPSKYALAAWAPGPIKLLLLLLGLAELGFKALELRLNPSYP